MKSDGRKIEAFETWCWRWVLQISWTEQVKNKKVYQMIKKSKVNMGDNREEKNEVNRTPHKK